jgi:F0F1-type ATP synthase epsilon subunit
MLPAVDGILEVTPGRWPLVTALRADFVVWYEGVNDERAAIQGGVAVFANDTLHILTSDSIRDASREEFMHLRERREAELGAMLQLPISEASDSLAK